MTELAMLWERTDPVLALTDRFGFADVERAVAWLDDTVREVWAGRLEQCERLVVSASNLLAWLTVDGRDVVAKCSADQARFARLADVDALLAWLHERGLPVASPVAAPDARLRADRGPVSIGLYPVLPGVLLEVDDSLQVEAAGRTLATLHDALAAYPQPIGDDDPKPGEQLVQGDFRSVNILFDGTRISGVLDFDDARCRPRTTDLAHASVLLGTRYHDWQPTTPSVRQAFVAAYETLAPLTDAQRSALGRDVSAVLRHFGWS